MSAARQKHLGPLDFSGGPNAPKPGSGMQELQAAAIIPAKKTKPLNPPATEAEMEHASALWTAASDDLVARGYARHLWGNLAMPAREIVILIIRASGSEPNE